MSKAKYFSFSLHSACNNPNLSLPSTSPLQDWLITLVDRENVMCTNTKCKANCINIFQTTLLVEVCIPLMEQREMVERTSYIALPRCSFFCCFLPFSPSISSKHLTAGSSYPVVKALLITNLKAIMT